MCWKIISAWCSRQRVRYATRSSSDSSVGLDRLQLAVSLDRGGLEGLVPVAKLLAPELLLEHLLGAREALRDLLLRRRPHRAVRESVDVPVVHGVEQHPVEAGELTEAAPEGLGMHLRPVAGHRARKVNGVELPRPRARRVEAKLGRCLFRVHWSPSSSRPDAYRRSGRSSLPRSPAASADAPAREGAERSAGSDSTALPRVAHSGWGAAAGCSRLSSATMLASRASAWAFGLPGAAWQTASVWPSVSGIGSFSKLSSSGPNCG